MTTECHENNSKLEKLLLHTLTTEVKVGTVLPFVSMLFMLYNLHIIKPMVEARKAFAQQQAIEMMVRVYSTHGSNEPLRYTMMQHYNPCMQNPEEAKK